MPTLGLNHQSSIINLDSCVDRLLHRHDASQALAPRPTGARIDSGGFERLTAPRPADESLQFFVSTLKEAPADAEVVSHRLMLRAGFIKRLRRHLHVHADGPARHPPDREHRREEMNRAGGVELLMPVVQPAELWRESGRFRSTVPS
jgi:hypothetical protein